MTFELMRAGLTPEVNAAGTIVFAISFAMAIAAAMATIFRPGRSR
jgi:ABC-type spermidine/putrescine transport system permease subunit II